MSNDFYEIKTAPSSDPIVFSESSDWCRDLDSSEQDLLESLISSATDLVESMTNRVFVQRTFTGYFSYFSTSKYEHLPFVQIKQSPLLEISSVKINDEVIDPEDYILKRKSLM